VSFGSRRGMPAGSPRRQKFLRYLSDVLRQAPGVRGGRLPRRATVGSCTAMVVQRRGRGPEHIGQKRLREEISGSPSSRNRPSTVAGLRSSRGMRLAPPKFALDLRIRPGPALHYHHHKLLAGHEKCDPCRHVDICCRRNIDMQERLPAISVADHRRTASTFSSSLRCISLIFSSLSGSASTTAAASCEGRA
jgi:hypothetical protein